MIVIVESSKKDEKGKIICFTCGAKVAAGAVECPECGEQLVKENASEEEEESSEKESEEDEEETTSEDEEEPEEEETENEEEKDESDQQKSAMPIFGLFLAFIGILGAICVLLVKMSGATIFGLGNPTNIYGTTFIAGIAISLVVFFIGLLMYIFGRKK